MEARPSSAPKTKKKTKWRRKHFVPFSVMPASRCDLLPPTAYVSRSPGGVSRSAAKSCRGGGGGGVAHSSQEASP